MWLVSLLCQSRRTDARHPISKPCMAWPGLNEKRQGVAGPVSNRNEKLNLSRRKQIVHVSTSPVAPVLHCHADVYQCDTRCVTLFDCTGAMALHIRYRYCAVRLIFAHRGVLLLPPRYLLRALSAFKLRCPLITILS